MWSMDNTLNGQQKFTELSTFETEEALLVLKA